MKTPFSTEQFFQIFEQYNLTVFPIQFLFTILGLLTVSLIWKNIKLKIKFIGYYLAGLWFWIGLAYYLNFFTHINPAAFGFAGIFILEGIFLLKETFSGNLQFSNESNLKTQLGLGLMIFALVLYPLIGYAIEVSIEKVVAIGLPSPSIILTFGLFLTVKKLPKYLLVIPVLWAMIGTWAAIDFGVFQDFMMLTAAIIAIVYTFDLVPQNTYSVE